MLALIVCIATLLTQRPLQRMNTATYFRDWFPYYIVRGDVPPEPTTSLYDVWRWRLLGTAALGVTIAAWRPPARLPVLRKHDSTSAAGHEDKVGTQDVT